MRREDDQLDEISAQLEAQLNARVDANTELATSTAATDLLLQKLEEALRSQASIRQELDETERLIESDKSRLKKQQTVCDKGTSRLDRLKAEGSRIAKAIEAQERENAEQAQRLESLLRDRLSGEATEAAAAEFRREPSQRSINVNYEGASPPSAADRSREQQARRSHFNLSVQKEEAAGEEDEEDAGADEEAQSYYGSRYADERHGGAGGADYGAASHVTSYTGRDDRPVGSVAKFSSSPQHSPPRKKYDIMLGKDGRPLSPLSAAQARSKLGLDPEDEDPSLRPTEFTACTNCGRNFSVDRIEKHYKICTKVSVNSSARKRDMAKSGYTKQRTKSSSSAKSVGGSSLRSYGGGGGGGDYNSGDYDDGNVAAAAEATQGGGGYNNQNYSNQGYPDRDYEGAGASHVAAARQALKGPSFSPNSSGNYRNEREESPNPFGSKNGGGMGGKDAKVVASADASIYDAAGNDGYEAQPTSGTACRSCGRTFAAPDRLAKHQKVCSKASKKPKKVFDPAKMRTAGTDAAKYQSRVKKSSAASARASGGAKKTNWRQKSEAFRAAMRAGRDPTAPAPPSFEDSDYVACDSCGRTFSQSAAERHIPKCRASKEIRNPLKKGRGGR